MRSRQRRRFDQLKRSVIRGAIADNLDTIHGVRRSRHRRLANRWLPWAPVAIVGLAAVAGGLRPVSTGTPERRPETPSSKVAGPPVGRSDRHPLPADLHAIGPSTFRLVVRRVVLDPGHGGDDPGAVASGVREKDLTLDIARRLRTTLKTDGLDVVMTREADDKVPLRQRAQAANDAHGDLFLSIHVNSIPTPERRGVETYVLGTTSDPRLAELSRAENAFSGYSFGDFRAILEGVLLDARLDASQRLGQAVQRSLYTVLRASNEELEDRGVKQAPFVVLLDTQMPAVLAEVACLSSADDLALLRDESYRQRIAEALAAGVLNAAAALSGAAVPARGAGAGR